MGCEGRIFKMSFRTNSDELYLFELRKSINNGKYEEFVQIIDYAYGHEIRTVIIERNISNYRITVPVKVLDKLLFEHPNVSTMELSSSDGLNISKK